MRNVNVNGTTLAVHIDGPDDGPVVVLSHSLFFDATMFDDVARILADDHRVVRYDHRAHGDSAGAELADLHMDTLTDDAAALIEELDLAPCVFAGNSMGGFVAQRLAARRPDLVRGVAAIGSSGEVEHKLEEFGPLVKAMQEHGAGPVLDTLQFIMFGDTSLGSVARAPMVAHWRERMATLGPMIGDAAHQVVHRDGVLDEVAEATVPVWVIAGAEDHAYEVQLSRNIADAAPDSRLEVVEEAGHSVSLERPEPVAALLAELVEATT